MADKRVSTVDARDDPEDGESAVALRQARVRFDHALGRDVNDVVKAPPQRN